MIFYHQVWLESSKIPGPNHTQGWWGRPIRIEPTPFLITSRYFQRNIQFLANPIKLKFHTVLQGNSLFWSTGLSNAHGNSSWNICKNFTSALVLISLSLENTVCSYQVCIIKAVILLSLQIGSNWNRTASFEKLPKGFSWCKSLPSLRN